MYSKQQTHYHNEELIKYYNEIFKEDNAVLDSTESLFDYSQKPLPISFRFNEYSPLIKFKKEILENSSVTLNPLDWLQEAYHIDDVCKYDFKRDPTWSKFRKLLIVGDDSGVLNRQELVSMLPVLFLNVKRGDNILDLCASPGMKYMQILNQLGNDLTGLVIGNDVSLSRLFTLAHRSTVLPVPGACLSHSDGAQFATIYDDLYKKIYFHKILLDAPCTCDGTLRKSPDIWKTWNPINSIHIHPVQVNLAKRAIDLLQPNGEIIYSTCSLNPLENEAVVSYMLSTGLVALVDLSEELKQFKNLSYSRGLRDWRVYYNGVWYSDYESVPEEHRNNNKISKSMFKQHWTSDCADKVIRIFPHQNNSGGFFIAKLRRLDFALSTKTFTFEKRDLSNPSQTIMSDANKVLHEYVPLQNFESISSFYGISDDFPKHLVFIKKSCVKSLYLFSETLAKICTGPFALKWAHAGVKIFTRLDPKIADGWRFCQEGITVISKYVKNRKLTITPEASLYLISDKDTANEYKNDYHDWYNNADIPTEPGGLILVTPGGLAISAIINRNRAIFAYVPLPKTAVLGIIRQELKCNS